jgi:hypothetical protein
MIYLLGIAIFGMTSFLLPMEEEQRNPPMELLQFKGTTESDILLMIERIMLEGIPVTQRQPLPRRLTTMAEKLEYAVEEQLRPDHRLRLSRIFRLLSQSSTSSLFITPTDPVIAEESLRELDVLIGSQQDNRDHSLAQRIRKTKLHIGYAILCRHLVQVKTGDNLRCLQDVIRNLSPEVRQSLNGILEEIAPLEDTFLSFWVSTERGMRDHLHDILETQKYKTFIESLNEWANSSPWAIEFRQLGNFFFTPIVSPLMSVASLGAGIAALNPYIILTGGYFTVNQGLGINQKWQELHYRAMALYLMQKKLISLSLFVEKLQNLRDLLVSHGFPKELLEPLVVPTILPEMRTLQNLLNTNTFKDAPAFCSHWGRICLAYDLMVQKRDEFIRAYAGLGTIDFISSLAELLANSTDTAPYCFANYTPNYAFQLQDIWSPLLSQNIVTNTILLGGNDPRTIIITGPNARGKTTILRSVGAAALLGSTLGIGPGRQIVIPINLNFLTSINISDDPARGLSLYVAGVRRIASIVLTLTAQPQRPCLVLLDEPFVGTRRQIAESASQQFLTRIGQATNTITLVTSHLPNLITLAQQYPQLFANYHVAAGYRFTPGVDTNRAQYDEVALGIVQQFLGNEFVDAVRRNLTAIQEAEEGQQANNIMSSLNRNIHEASQ